MSPDIHLWLFSVVSAHWSILYFPSSLCMFTSSSPDKPLQLNMERLEIPSLWFSPVTGCELFIASAEVHFPPFCTHDLSRVQMHVCQRGVGGFRGMEITGRQLLLVGSLGAAQHSPVCWRTDQLTIIKIQLILKKKLINSSAWVLNFHSFCSLASSRGSSENGNHHCAGDCWDSS